MNRQFKHKQMKEHIQFINSAGFLDGEFSASDSDANFAEKRALVLVEGVHKDSNKRIHKFDAARIQEIVNNTNDFLMNGGRIPWQKDHKKEQAYNIGDLESALEVRVITEKNLPNPRLRHLIGKVGIFADKLVAKGRENVEAVLSKSISTLSPGIDVVNNIIKEISATPTPAIVGPSTFSRYNSDSANFALTMEEAEVEDQNMDAQKEEFEALCDRFWNVMMNISAATEEELQGEDPYTLSQQALESFEDRIYELFGLADTDEMGNPMNPNMMQGQTMPNYVRNQQEIRPTVGSRAGFSMSEVERNMANFAYSQNNPVQQRRRGSALGTAAKVGAGLSATAAVGAAGYRYGRPAFGAARKAYSFGRSSMGQSRRQALGVASKAFGGMASRRLGRDLTSVGRRANVLGRKAGRNVAGKTISRVGKAVRRLGERLV